MLNQYYSSGNTQGTTSSDGLNFAPPKTQKLSRYDLDIDTSKAVRFENLTIEKDSNGDCKAAQYSSGAFVRRHKSYMILKAYNHSLWMGDRFGGWHPLD